MKPTLQRITELRRAGWTWAKIGVMFGRSGEAIRSWGRRAQERAKTDPPPDAGVDARTTVILTKDDVERITSLDDLIAFFRVDTNRWSVRDFRVNKWEQHSVTKGVVPLYQVRANLIRNVERDAKIAQRLLAQAALDMREHAPVYTTPPPVERQGSALYEIAIMDPHLGMRSWKEETGENYDLDIATTRYIEAAEHLVRQADSYDVERVVYILGNDLLHVDTLHDKVATTTAGTPQDYDTRLAKIFTEARRAVVRGIDAARNIAPVDVIVVPGNHDEHSMYKLGEVLSAWYRNDERVSVLNAPTKRKYYIYGKNLLGFTHGLETGRKREPLPLIMATEAPELWARSTHREWHVGHRHAVAELNYMAPVGEMSESRGVRVRSLPGLTASDAWHTEKGYAHQAAATALVFHRDGGLLGLHEYHPRAKNRTNE